MKPTSSPPALSWLAKWVERLRAAHLRKTSPGVRRLRTNEHRSIFSDVTLSVACYTREPGHRVAAALKPLRAIADEIVIAVDSRVGVDALGDYATVADRVLRFEYAAPNRCLAWLHAQCSGQWVLHLDGDEVPSVALLDQLPEMITAHDVLQYEIPRRWLYPDAHHWLDEMPWWPDYQNRLVRNDGTLWFAGTMHTGAAKASPRRYVEWPIYHLSCVLLSEAERGSKVVRYERADPGLVAPGGLPLNEAYYLPERHARLPPEPVPECDRQILDAVLAARPSGRRVEDPVAVVSSARVELHWNQRTIGREAYRARIALFERGVRMSPGELRPVHVRVTNEGSESWPGGSEQKPEIRVSYHWLDRDGAVREFDGMRTPLPCRLAPGSTTVVPALVRAPPEAGDFVLEIDLVHEHVRWFDCSTTIAVAVAPVPGARSAAT